ncbi:hypothetical protein [Inhella gelatinilytica]|uniref:Uncharacterized protein n=1 Tax=Inhella gelatinilytica TaxID=2795030 RepID=A0A931NE91_9BURK|nr:hypothetical protein [Inhella gelatinilytica]MBH9552261.1 hypothetical protein [Inhella gelatinilytica]
MNLIDVIDRQSPENMRSVLKAMLSTLITPAFGVHSKSEIELAVFRAFIQIGALPDNPQIYELVSGLRISRTKARRLIYDHELRTKSEADLHEEALAILRRPVLQKRGDSLALAVERPLVSDYIRAKVQERGRLTDGSFSPNIIILGVDAYADLVDFLIPDANKKEAIASMIAAGVPENSVKGFIVAVCKKLASTVADDVGRAAVEEYVSPMIDGGFEKFSELMVSIFNKS